MSFALGGNSCRFPSSRVTDSKPYSRAGRDDFYECEKRNGDGLGAAAKLKPAKA